MKSENPLVSLNLNCVCVKESDNINVGKYFLWFFDISNKKLMIFSCFTDLPDGDPDVDLDQLSQDNLSVKKERRFLKKLFCCCYRG